MSAGRQPGQHEVPGGGGDGDRDGGRGTSAGADGPAAAQAGDLLLMPGAVEQVVDGLVADGLRYHQTLVGGPVQQAPRQVRLVSDGAGQADDIDRTAVQRVVHALPGAESA